MQACTGLNTGLYSSGMHHLSWFFFSSFSVGVGPPASLKSREDFYHNQPTTCLCSHALRTVGRWIVISFPKLKLRVLSVRGTSSVQDAYLGWLTVALASQFMIVLYWGKCQKKTTCIFGCEVRRSETVFISCSRDSQELKRLWNRLVDLATLILCSHDFSNSNSRLSALTRMVFVGVDWRKSYFCSFSGRGATVHGHSYVSWVALNVTPSYDKWTASASVPKKHRGLFCPWCQWQWQGGRANKRCGRWRWITCFGMFVMYSLIFHYIPNPKAELSIR